MRGHATVRLQDGSCYRGDYLLADGVLRLEGRPVTQQASGRVYCASPGVWTWPLDRVRSVREVERQPVVYVASSGVCATEKCKEGASPIRDLAPLHLSEGAWA